MRIPTFRRQQGFGVVAAVIVLLLLAALAAAILSLSTTQHANFLQDANSANASLAARAGTEWGLSRALNANDNYCNAGALGVATSQGNTLDLSAVTGMQVTVTCESVLYNEGRTNNDSAAQTVSVYRITAVACPTAPCPGNAATPGYIERRHEVVAAD